MYINEEWKDLYLVALSNENNSDHDEVVAAWGRYLSITIPWANSYLDLMVTTIAPVPLPFFDGRELHSTTQPLLERVLEASRGSHREHQMKVRGWTKILRVWLQWWKLCRKAWIRFETLSDMVAQSIHHGSPIVAFPEGSFQPVLRKMKSDLIRNVSAAVRRFDTSGVVPNQCPRTLNKDTMDGMKVWINTT